MDDFIRNNCEEYSPKNMPELRFFYRTLPGEVDICDAIINGGEISEDLYTIVVDARRSTLEAEVEDHERQKAKAYREDCMTESYLINKLIKAS